MDTSFRAELVEALHDAKSCIERALQATDVKSPSMAREQLCRNVEAAEGKLSRVLDLIPHHTTELAEQLKE